MKELILLVPLLFACGLSSQSKETISNNSRSSACDGFKVLAKSIEIGYQQDTIDYCSAEKLRWQYDTLHKVLSLLHTRNKQNCGAKLEMTASYEGDVYAIAEHDKGNSNLDCLCYFDTYCEVPNVEQDSVVISFESRNYSLDLANEKGVIVLDSTRTWPCLGQL